MRPLLLCSLLFLLTLTGHSADPVRPGYCKLGYTLSPDSAYAIVWAPTGLAPEALATLPEWPLDYEPDTSATSYDDFLFDCQHHRILAKLPDFDYFENQAWHKNRGDLHIAWSPDSRSALAICEERWDDNAIAWIDIPTQHLTDLKAHMEKALEHTIRTREKDHDVAIQFCEPVILPGGLVVVDANAGHEKEGPYYLYRLTFRATVHEGRAQLALLKARKISDKEQAEHNSGVDYDPDLNRYYAKLRGRLDEKARAALKQEEEAWLQWRDAQPEPAREKLTTRHAVELRARCEK